VSLKTASRRSDEEPSVFTSHRRGCGLGYPLKFVVVMK